MGIIDIWYFEFVGKLDIILVFVYVYGFSLFEYWISWFSCGCDYNKFSILFCFVNEKVI